VSPAPPSAEPGFYVVGGTLRPGSPSYVERPADRELLEHLLAGELCYVLTPRQMGKSSLMARTHRELRRQGWVTAVVDLSQVGTGEGSTENWYRGILHRICQGAGIRQDLAAWWGEREGLPAVGRLMDFFTEVLLGEISGPVAIFFDEIDTTLAVPGSDDFFAALRACTNARATDPRFERLTFALFGVASPGELIQDARRTPFNVGHRIELADFTPEQAEPLAHGLAEDPEVARALLGRILHWSGGHPYLTQKLCRLAARREGREGGGDLDEEEIDRLAALHFLSPEASRQEPNLSFVRDRLLAGEKRRDLLALYRRVRTGKKPVPDDPLSSTQAALKLSGLVEVDARGRLTVRNRIYARVFDPEWVRQEMPARGVRAAVAAGVLLLLGSFLVWYLAFLPAPYIEALAGARQDVPLEAYTRLRVIPGQGGKADRLFAAYWDRRALEAAGQGDRDRAILLALEALSLEATPQRRAVLRNWIGEDYPLLEGTLRTRDPITAVAFSEDGGTLRAATAAGTIASWEPWGAGYVRSLVLPTESAGTPTAFDEKGERILTSGQLVSRGAYGIWQARVFDATSGAQEGIEHRQEGVVFQAGFLADSSTLWLLSDFSTLTLLGPAGPRAQWDARTGKPSQPSPRPPLSDLPRLPTTAVTRATAGRDGQTLVTGYLNGLCQLWDLSASPFLVSLARWTAPGRIGAVALGGEGKWAAAGTTEGHLLLWSRDPEEAPQPPVDLGAEVGVLTVAFRPGHGKDLLALGSDGALRFRDGATGRLRPPRLIHSSSLPAETPVLFEAWVSEVPTALFHPGGEYLVTAGAGPVARLWRVPPGAAPGTSVPGPPTLPHPSRITALSADPEARQLLSVDAGDTVHWWQLDPPRELATFSAGEPGAGAESSPAPAPPRPELQIPLFHPSGPYLLTTGTDGALSLKILRPEGNRTVHLPTLERPRKVAVGRDGERLLIAGVSRAWTVRLPEGTPIGTELALDGVPRQLGFDPAGRRILILGDEGVVRIFDAETGDLLHEHLVEGRIIRAVFSPDGEELLVVYEAGRLALRNATTGEILATTNLPAQAPKGEELAGNSTPRLDRLAFSPDGSTVLAFARFWVYRYRPTPAGELEVIGARLLPAPFAGEFLPLTADGSRLRVATLPTGDAIALEDLVFDEPPRGFEGPLLEGDPAELLGTWEKALALGFNEAGELAPNQPLTLVTMPITLGAEG